MSDTILVPLFDILSFGAITVLIVIGLGVIASMMGIFNFAQGEFVLIGAYTTFLAYHAGWPVISGMMLAPLVAGVAGLVIEFTIIRRLYGRPISAMLATWAIGLAIRETVRILTAGLYIAIPEPVGGSIVIGGASISAWRFVVLLVTVIVVAISWLVLSKTSFGLQVRASLENPALARCSGLSTDFVYAATFCFGTALAGLAGALVVPLFSLFADLGLRFLVQGFASVLIGGVGTFVGPIAGGAVIGVLGSSLPWVMSPVTADVLIFILAITFVKFRPMGLISGRGV